MAAAARDYLAVPTAEVDVEKLFNSGKMNYEDGV